MASFRLKYADARGEVRQQVLEAPSEDELRSVWPSRATWCTPIRPAAGVGTSSARVEARSTSRSF